MDFDLAPELWFNSWVRINSWPLVQILECNRIAPHLVISVQKVINGKCHSRAHTAAESRQMVHRNPRGDCLSPHMPQPEVMTARAW